MIPFYKTVGFARYGQAGVEKSDHYVKKETHEETHYKSVSCAGVLSDPAADIGAGRGAGHVRRRKKLKPLSVMIPREMETSTITLKNRTPNPVIMRLLTLKQVMQRLGTVK